MTWCVCGGKMVSGCAWICIVQYNPKCARERAAYLNHIWTIIGCKCIRNIYMKLICWAWRIHFPRMKWTNEISTVRFSVWLTHDRRISPQERVQSFGITERVKIVGRKKNNQTELANSQKQKKRLFEYIHVDFLLRRTAFCRRKVFSWKRMLVSKTASNRRRRQQPNEKSKCYQDWIRVVQIHCLN